jgi:hypothetical protein
VRRAVIKDLEKSIKRVSPTVPKSAGLPKSVGVAKSAAVAKAVVVPKAAGNKSPLKKKAKAI